MVTQPRLRHRRTRRVGGYPDVILDITTDDSHVDIVAAGFGAGIHFGEYIRQDMLAVRVSEDLRAATVAAPKYFESHSRPKTPPDLRAHRCINFGHGAEGIYRWEFNKGRRSMSVAVTGPRIVDDVQVVIRAALDGVGLAFMGEDLVTDHLANGALVRVLEDWCPPFPGFFLYYPGRRQQPTALAALIEVLRL